MGGWIIETTHIAQTDILEDSLTQKGPRSVDRQHARRDLFNLHTRIGDLKEFESCVACIFDIVTYGEKKSGMMVQS